MKLSSILLGFLVVCNSTGCKPRVDSDVKQVRPIGGGSNDVTCTFDMSEEQSKFVITATLGANALTNVTGQLSTLQGAGETKSKDSAPVAQPKALEEMYDKKLRDQQDTDRSVRAYEKDLYRIDRSNYTCFDVSGIGPKNEDYFCMHKSMQVGSAQALWISNYRYAKDLNVINVMGSSCLAKN